MHVTAGFQVKLAWSVFVFDFKDDRFLLPKNMYFSDHKIDVKSLGLETHINI